MVLQAGWTLMMGPTIWRRMRQRHGQCSASRNRRRFSSHGGGVTYRFVVGELSTGRRECAKDDGDRSGELHGRN